MNQQERNGIFSQAESARIKGDYDAALPLYEKILAADSMDHEAILGVAYCQLNQGLFDESIESFQDAKRVDPLHVKGRLELAKILAMLGMFPEAKREFLTVLSLDPDNDTALEQLAYFPDDIEPAPEEDDAAVASAPQPTAAATSAQSAAPTFETTGSSTDDDEADADEDDELEFF